MLAVTLGSPSSFIEINWFCTYPYYNQDIDFFFLNYFLTHTVSSDFYILTSNFFSVSTSVMLPTQRLWTYWRFIWMSHFWKKLLHYTAQLHYLHQLKGEKLISSYLLGISMVVYLTLVLCLCRRRLREPRPGWRSCRGRPVLTLLLPWLETRLTWPRRDWWSMR